MAIKDYSGVEAVHVWVYDDSVVFGPLSTLWVNDERVMVWSEVLKFGMSLVIKATKSQITCKRQVWDACATWAKSGGYGGMGLADYVNRMLAQFPGALKE